MKAFTFRLEQALRWRATQGDLAKTSVAAAAGRLSVLEADLESRRSDLSAAASRVSEGPTGGALEAYARFKERSHARIRNLEGQVLLAQRTFTLEMNRLVEANKKLRVLENLKGEAQGRWRREFDRELADFADESFLARRQV
jgi:flagellar export protein FliJ